MSSRIEPFSCRQNGTKRGKNSKGIRRKDTTYPIVIFPSIISEILLAIHFRLHGLKLQISGAFPFARFLPSPSPLFSASSSSHRDKHFRIALTHFNIQRRRVEIDRTCYRPATGEKSDVARIKSAENGIKESNESFSPPLFLAHYRAYRFADRFELTRGLGRVDRATPCESLPL